MDVNTLHPRIGQLTLENEWKPDSTLDDAAPNRAYFGINLIFEFAA